MNPNSYRKFVTPGTATTALQWSGNTTAKGASRPGDFKGVCQNVSRGLLEIELHNLARAPGEMTDIAAERPEIVDRTQRVMNDERTVSEDFLLGPLN